MVPGGSGCDPPSFSQEEAIGISRISNNVFCRSSTMATYGGQNVGAGKTERLGKGIKAAGIIGIIYSIVAFVLLYFFASYIALLFVAASETEIIRLTHQFIVYSALFYIPLTFVNVIRFCIQGMGFSTFAILAGVFEMAARYEENALLEAVLKSIGNKKVTLYEMQGFDHGQVLGPACYLIADYVKRFK